MQTRSIDFEGEDLAHDGEEDAEPGRADSPTTGDFEAIHSAGHSSHFQNTPTHSTQGSASGSSWSSSRRMGAPSVCLSFRSNGQFQLSSPPSRRTCSSRKSNSTLSSHFSFSAAQQLAAANQAARASLIGGAASTSVASSHRHSQASMASDIQSSSPQQHMQAGRIKDEPETLTPAQELMCVLMLIYVCHKGLQLTCLLQTVVPFAKKRKTEQAVPSRACGMRRCDGRWTMCRKH